MTGEVQVRAAGLLAVGSLRAWRDSPRHQVAKLLALTEAGQAALRSGAQGITVRPQSCATWLKNSR
jgi:hypothetical protein